MYQTQRLASDIVTAVLSGRNLTDTLNAVWRRESTLEPRQRAAIQDVSYGTLRRYGEINHILKQLLTRPDVDPEVQSLLATSIYQLAWGRAAPYAIVDHAVKVASHLNHGRAKGLVNAVLRNFLRQKEVLLKSCGDNPVAMWNHPDWWILAMKEAWPDQWQDMLHANNSRPPMSLRVNQRKILRDAYLELLQTAAIEAHPEGEQGIRLQNPTGVDQLPGFFDGLCSVQDIGAQWAAPLLQATAGMKVLDACCAPGGKTGHLLELADIDLTALDADAQRLTRVTSNLERLELKARVIQGDAARPDTWWDGVSFDRILADVPCSASGVARRHPDIKWLRRPSDFVQFATQQSVMIDALWGCLKPGGTLLYATCSVFPEENEQQIAAFLSRTHNARRLPLRGNLPQHGQLLPNTQHDGFYYALLAKN